MKTESPSDLLFDQLLDLYSVEMQLSKALPLLITQVSHSDLQALLVEHTKETVAQRDTLYDILESYDISSKKDQCKAMAGLIKGGADHLREVENPRTRDLMMIAHCLRIEYYELAAYDVTRRLAGRLGFEKMAASLLKLVGEEERTASRLKELEPIIFEIAHTQSRKV